MNIVGVLGLDSTCFQELANWDRRRFEEDWQCWASEPVERQLRFLPFAGLWYGESLPEQLSREQANDFVHGACGGNDN